LEQNVFNRPEVAQAVHQNYVAVKVHAGQNPQLAARYRVNRWPTDVFVTPVGQEVYRTISPQKPNEYVAVLHQVAQQTGIGATRPWSSQLAQAVVPASAQAALEAQRAAGALNAAGQQASTAAQSAMLQAQNHMGAAMNQFQQFNNQAQQTSQQAASAAQHGLYAANQWGQQAASSAQQYQQQASDARDQLRQQAGQFGQQLEQNAQAAQQQLASTAAQTAQQVQQTASAFAQPWQQSAGTLYDRRSAFVPAQPLAESPPASAGPQQSAPPQQQTPPSLPVIQPPPPAAATARNGVPLPQENPWLSKANSALGRAAIASGATVAETPSPLAQPPMQVPVKPQAPASQPSVAAAPPPSTVPASQAPPIAIDGFCPVTLLDTLASDPSGRSAWKKGDKQFGAIHRGRTYLFTSAAHQQKFLASPDAYAPALSGCDPVIYAERGQFVDGKRAYGIITPDRQIYLFADENSRNRFEKSPTSFTAAIQQAMQRSEAGTLYR
jgi:YHS domain-containing protein